MNVTSRGYYTTQYLDQYRIKPKPSQTGYDNNTIPRQQSSSSLNKNEKNHNIKAQDAGKPPSTPKVNHTHTSDKKEHLMIPQTSNSNQKSTPNSPAVKSTSQMNTPRSGIVYSSESADHLVPPSKASHRSRPGTPAPKSQSSTAIPSAKSSVQSTPKSKPKSSFNLSPISRITNSKRDAIDDDYSDTLSKPDDLQQEITPAQLNIIQNRHRDAEIQKQLERRKRRFERQKRKQPDIIHGKSARKQYNEDAFINDYSSDETEEDDYSSFYYDYGDDKNSDKNLKNLNSGKKKYDYSDYYVLEKKKYEESPFKPKMYTHKTFKEVFQDKNENVDRFNPMDLVFQQPEEDVKEQKFKSAFKSFQSKLKQNSYNDYDYYAEKEKQREARAKKREQEDKAKKSKEEKTRAEATDVFADGSSDDSDNEALFAYLPDETKQDMKKNNNFKKLWRKKIKTMKKELGQDYINNYHKNKNLNRPRNSQDDSEEVVEHSPEAPGSPKRSPQQSKKLNKLDAIDDGDDNTSDDEIFSSDDEERPKEKPKSGLGPDPAFNPLWNYILSWLVYEKETPKVKEDDEDYFTSDYSDIEEDAFKPKAKNNDSQPQVAQTPKEAAKAASIKDKKKNKNKKKNASKLNLTGLKKNYKAVVSNWNQPASALFTGDLSQLEYEKRREADALLANAAAEAAANDELGGSKKSSHNSFYGQDFNIDSMSEIEVEVSDDDDASALYYNPVTASFDRSPPTSSNSMEIDSRSISSKSLKSPSVKSLKSMKSSRSSKSSRSLGSKTRMKTESSAASKAKNLINSTGSPKEMISNINSMIKSIPYMKIVFAPIDVIGENFPHLQTFILIVELVVFIWMFYEITKLINALCLTVQAICAPMIAVGRLMNRIM